MRKPVQLGLIGLVILSLSLGFAVLTPAQMPHDTAALEADTEFQSVHQPLWLKLTVVGVGMGLIGLELWWFVWSQPKAHPRDGIE
ncbi:MAG TPA: hypothetical protein IGR64_08960 [Leptolyngbyaceae cyanobacterium M65_K2018_010]|nr:hypothetical protein [Leptolyngbyaceae cyanobacterium M65_K2018_010]